MKPSRWPGSTKRTEPLAEDAPDGSVLHCGGHSGSRNPGPDALRAVDDAGFGLPRGDIAARHVTWAGPHGIIKASSARLAPQRPADAFRTSLSARVFRPGLSDQGHSPSPFDRVHRCPLPNCVFDWPPTGCTMKTPMPRCSLGCAPVPPPSVNWAQLHTVGSHARRHRARGHVAGLQRIDPLSLWPRGRADETGGARHRRSRRPGAVRRRHLPDRSGRSFLDFPEALALKRQCITHGRPFISTLAGAIEWMEVERVHAGLTPDASLSRMFDYEGQTLALIAHDALKDEMVAFASEHFDVLSRFARRVATGTTGGRLNDLAWSRGWPKDKPLGTSLPERAAGRRRANRRTGAGTPMPARDLLRGSPRGAPARGGYPVAGARGARGHGVRDLRDLAVGGAAGRRRWKSAEPETAGWIGGRQRSRAASQQRHACGGGLLRE